jgi:hypothetical protein
MEIRIIPHIDQWYMVRKDLRGILYLMFADRVFSIGLICWGGEYIATGHISLELPLDLLDSTMESTPTSPGLDLTLNLPDHLIFQRRAVHPSWLSL